MVKKVIDEPGRTFGEFSLLTGYTKKDTTLMDISLETTLADHLTLKIPILSAAMTSVTEHEMALALGKEGGIGILPARMPVEVQADIVAAIKNYEMGFVQEPVTARETETIEEVLRKVEKLGHSKIPVVDRNNVFLGIFLRQHYWEIDVGIQENVTLAMVPFKPDGKIPFCRNPLITIDEVKTLLQASDQHYLVLLDEQDRLIKLAFKKDAENIKVGSAITTYTGWEKRVEANITAGVDLIVIDTSDGHSEFCEDVVRAYKAMANGVPLCAGNIITYEGALCLMEAGADIVKVGMSSGSICTTQREKATGRAPMTALLEADRARGDFFRKTGRYVPLIMDGGLTGAADIVIALTTADAVMLGGYLNRFFEAAGEKFDRNGKVTRDENEMVSVATWGEGSARAINLDRYGHSSRKTFFEEGVEGAVHYLGRLKPTLKKDLMKIRAALSNAGCRNLKELRENAVIEVSSLHSSGIISAPHHVDLKR